MDGAGSGSFPVTHIGINGVESSYSGKVKGQVVPVLY
jgi:hypothetical protein